jgi:hypothetical protein
MGEVEPVNMVDTIASIRASIMALATGGWIPDKDMGKGTEGSSRIKELGEGMGMEMGLIMDMDMITDRHTAADEVIKVICPFRTDTAMEDIPSKIT